MENTSVENAIKAVKELIEGPKILYPDQALRVATFYMNRLSYQIENFNYPPSKKTVMQSSYKVFRSLYNRANNSKKKVSRNTLLAPTPGSIAEWELACKNLASTNF